MALHPKGALMLKYALHCYARATLMPKRYLVLMLTCGYFCLAGCGTRGPLYIPEQRYPVKTSNEPSTPPPETAPEATPK